MERRHATIRGRARVDGAAAVADEAHERDAPVVRQLDGERRRGADGDEDRAAGDCRLLDELEREPAADAEDRFGERHEPLAERPAEHLVHRVVAADVLTHAEELSVRREQPRRVEPAGQGEGRLRLAQAAGKRGDDVEGDGDLLSIRGASTATASSAPFPQTPHEDEV